MVDPLWKIKRLLSVCGFSFQQLQSDSHRARQQLGNERKIAHAIALLDDFAYSVVRRRRQQIEHEGDKSQDLVALYLREVRSSG